MPGLNIECPHCQSQFNQELREVTINTTRQCPECSGEIVFTGSFLIKVLRRMDGPRGFQVSGKRRRSIQ